ncbi:MAG: MFS transporter [Geodermatophilaceae bacterium]|nr:MFS transporter [Geodermatophilaceae bacterium]
MTSAPTRPHPAGAMVLAVGVVALEFAAAVSTFVSSTLLPTVARDLDARDHLSLLIAGSTMGLFVALPLASRVVGRLGAARTLSVGLIGYVGGAVVTATSRTAWVFAAGQVGAGLASGLLAVFGITAIIAHLDGELRVRVIAASSAMWIVPALVGPPVTLALEHLVGWRWALLLPVPIVLVGRMLVVRAARPDGVDDEQLRRPLGRTLLIPVGVGALVLSSAHPTWWPVAVTGALVALAGVATIMPRGTIRLRRGTPAALGAMLFFATGYFGADSLITVLLTDGYATTLAQAAVALSVAPLAWALTSLLVPRLVRGGKRRYLAAAGLTLTACGVTALAAVPLVSPSFGAALAAWTVAGVGVGLAYPSLYLICTSTDESIGFGAVELATAVITAEAFGGLFGRAAGGAITSLNGTAGMAALIGLSTAYAVFALFLFAAVIAATRSTPPAMPGVEPLPG